jgi:glycine dehydrogenase
VEQSNEFYFDTLNCVWKARAAASRKAQEAEAAGINFRYFDEVRVGISLHQNTELHDVADIVSVFAKVLGKEAQRGRACPPTWS